MKTKFIVGAAIASAMICGANAQTSGDLLRYSQYNYSFGTARSAAMGGAFTSLGADLSSMNINPAGLGMYRSSEIGITPIISSASTSSTFDNIRASDSKTRFSIGNFGAALNLYQGSGSLTSFTFGFGYNKLMDYNTTSLTRGYDRSYSILDHFASQLQGVPENEIFQNYPDKFYNFPGKWGAILAYEAFLVNPNNDPGIDADYIPVISAGTLMNQVVRNVSRGSIGEYSFSGGFNIANIVYLGATIGLQDLSFENTNNYYEEVASSEPGFTEDLLNFTYRRSLIVTGTGVNGKFGAIVRPIPDLRIGISYHTPTFINVNDQYMEDMRSNFRGGVNNQFMESPANVFDYAIRTPSRLLGGISYAFPYGIVSADYERVWYNSMRIRQTGDAGYEDQIEADVKNIYAAANNFRLGLEVTPLYGFYIRGGFAYYGDVLRNANTLFVNERNIKSYNCYSGGLGYRFGNVALDFAYVNTQYKVADYILWESAFGIERGSIRDRISRNTFLLSTSLRF